MPLRLRLRSLRLTTLGLSSYALLAALLAACGDDEGPKGPAVRELPELYAAALCSEVEACLDPRGLTQVFGELGCEAWVTAQGEDRNLPAVQSAIEQDRVKYDASKVEPCLAELEGLGCDFSTARALTRGVCEKIFTGTVETGGDCDVDEECEGVAFCKRGDACPGTCSALLGPGDTCEKDEQCEDGLRCTGDETCAAAAGDGEPCGGNTGVECSPELACIGADDMTGAPGKCMQNAEVFVGAEGATCSFDNGMLCESGLSCIVESFMPTTATLTLVCAEGVGAGEPCKFGAPSQCPVDQRCDADITAGDVAGTCVTLPVAGEVCVMAAGSPECAPGLHCDDSGHCHTLARLTEDCESNDDCASDHCSWPERADGMPDETKQGTCDRPEVCEL